LPALDPAQSFEESLGDERLFLHTPCEGRFIWPIPVRTGSPGAPPSYPFFFCVFSVLRLFPNQDTVRPPCTSGVLPSPQPSLHTTFCPPPQPAFFSENPRNRRPFFLRLNRPPVAKNPFFPPPPGNAAFACRFFFCYEVWLAATRWASGGILCVFPS